MSKSERLVVRVHPDIPVILGLMAMDESATRGEKVTISDLVRWWLSPHIKKYLDDKPEILEYAREGTDHD